MLVLNNNILTIGGNRLEGGPLTPPVDPYNPLGLPPYTIRLKFKPGTIPSFSKGTATLVSSIPPIWDLTYESDNWFSMLKRDATSGLLEVMGANTSNITRFEGIFSSCSSLTSVSLFDTSSMTNVSSLFNDCRSLTTVPLFDTSNVTNMNYMFYGCTNVQSGALALYQQASSQANPPSSHEYTFTNCGSNTQTGAAELVQIPSSWGGTGA